ncbi:hypothetical protein NPX13_g6979 [Xylaria arbuscula]|uniref:Uncharacterized protein n=1 Tax=Xylaria arbuscula TaxID=114810 RepID=A0A9W8TJM0_9PEZI|nr:hypothetical protein NPX13_g6979 [Xylaria arbuscula]
MPPRRPFKPRPYQPSVGRPDVPCFSRGTILDNGLIGEKPRGKGQLEASKRMPDPAEAENDLYTLNSLQLRRGWPLEPLSVQIPMEYLRDNLPPDAQKLLGIAICGSTYIFNCDEGNVDRRIGKMFRRWPEFWDIFRTSEYVFWPIEAAKGYFVTAIFHMEKGQMDDPDYDLDYELFEDPPQVPNPQYTIVGAWSVIDGQRGVEAQDQLERVKDRIERIFTAEGIVFRPKSFMQHVGKNGEKWNEPWVPPPSLDEDWSSGIRSFALVRQLIQRVLDTYCCQGHYDDDFFRKPTCGWINVDQVRYEMMGICAINVIEDMDWNGRLAVECIQRITTVEGVEPFRARSLAPYNDDKEAYIPESDVDSNPLSL